MKANLTVGLTGAGTFSGRAGIL